MTLVGVGDLGLFHCVTVALNRNNQGLLIPFLRMTSKLKIWKLLPLEASRLLNIKVEFSVEDLEIMLILQNSTLFENKSLIRCHSLLNTSMVKSAIVELKIKALEKATIEWESAKTIVEEPVSKANRNYIIGSGLQEFVGLPDVLIQVAVSFGYKVLGWRSILAYNFVIVRAFLFWVQDSLDEKCEVLLHPNGLSEDGTTTL
ncbi:hypothetical protein Tco_0206339 [Tanacetum coccineum]